MYEQQDDSSWSFAIGLFIGAAAGAALASLFSPRTGQQNRESVREQGLVLKSRVTNATTSATSNVKDTRDSVIARVSETAATVKEKASSAVETVSETASTAASKVQDAASSAAARVSETASTAAEKARTLTQGAASQPTGAADDEIVVASVGELAHEASYDAEDARPATTQGSATAAELVADIASVNPHPASSDRPIDTSGRSDVTEVLAVSEAPTEPLTIEDDLGAIETEPVEDRLGTTEALAELASDEQFEVDASTAAGSDADVQEASEGSERPM